MMNRNQYRYILDHRFHSNRVLIDLFIQTLFIIDDRSQYIRAKEHDQYTARHMNAERVAEYIHDETDHRANHHIHAMRKCDRHHQQAHHVDVRMAYTEEL